MGQDRKIFSAMIVFVACAALCFVAVFGIHYVLGNPFSVPIPMDMNTFTIVNGGDVSDFQVTKYFASMRIRGVEYSQITQSAYCAIAENTYEVLNKKMADDGYEYLGYDGNSINVRGYYKDGFIQWVRIEFDNNQKWAVWNFGIPEEYNIETQGYKTLN